MKNLIIIGTSTTSEHVYNFVTEYKLFHVKGFAVDKEYQNGKIFMSLPLYAIDELDEVMDKNTDLLFVSIMWNKLNAERRDVYNKLKDAGYQFANLISPTAKIRGVLLGDNCWVHDYAIVQHDATVGSNVLVMAYSLIGALSHIGDHSFLGAKSTIAGGCNIGSQTFVGINSTVFDGTSIGEKCIIGACTAVKRNMPECSVYRTSSDQIEIKEYSPNEIENKLQFKLNNR